MTDKPLPSPPSSSGIGQWWKRNRHRSKQSSSPGQAELGLGTLLSPSGSRRTTYDLEALTKQLAAVDFGRNSGESKSSRNASNSAGQDGSPYPPVFPLPLPPMPPRPVTTLGYPPDVTSSQLSATSPPSKRAPVYALHVKSENLQHSASAPQLDTHSQRSTDSSLRPCTESPYHMYRPAKHYMGADDVFGASRSIPTFDPDVRSLERLPDRPAENSRALPGQNLRRSTAQPHQSFSSVASPYPSAASYLEPPQSPPVTHIPGCQTTHRTSSTTPTAAESQFRIPITPSRRPAPTTPTRTPGSTTTRSGKSPAASLVSPFAVQCSGYTQKGQRCKKKVKSVAAYYAIRPPSNLNKSTRSHTPPLFTAPGKENEPLWTSSSLSCGAGPPVSVGMVAGDEEKRFCSMHTGQICSPEGFYCRNRAVAGEMSMSRGKWVQFSDYIPDDLEEQTKVLLRLTMESPLTNNESYGFIYAYELRDLGTDSIAYYKVGRTDNVPRRINEWKLQCVSHRPTLRDIFPQRDRATTNAGPRASSSVLPGAMSNQEEQCMAVKRLEKLIHIELSARQVTLERLLVNQPIATLLHTGRPCPDCQTTHREIFAISRDYQHHPLHQPQREQHDETLLAPRESVEYETVVRSVILRWQGFVDKISL